MPRTVLLATKSGSSSAGTEILPKMQLEEDQGEPVLENGFHPHSLVFMIWTRAFVLCVYLWI